MSPNLYDIYHRYVYSKKLLMVERNCLKHVEFHSKNKFEKLVHLVGFILRNLSQCMVIRTSNTGLKSTPADGIKMFGDVKL